MKIKNIHLLITFLLPAFLVTLNLSSAAGANQEDNLFADKNAGKKERLLNLIFDAKKAAVRISEEINAIALAQLTLNRRKDNCQQRCMAYATAQHLSLEQSKAMRDALGQEMIQIQEEFQLLQARKEQVAQGTADLFNHNFLWIKTIAEELSEDPYITTNEYFSHMKNNLKKL